MFHKAYMRLLLHTRILHTHISRTRGKGKGKVNHALQESMGVLIALFQVLSP